MLNLTPRGIDWENGAGFEIFVPEISGASVLEEIANSYESDSTEGEDNEGDNSGNDDTAEVINPGSPSGGCDSLTGSIMLLGLAGLALTQTKRRK